MAPGANLSTFSPKAFEGPRSTITSIEKKIETYKARKETIQNLALWTLANLAVLISKATWDLLSGVELKSSMLSTSSIIFGVFSFALGLGTVFYWLHGFYQKYQITTELNTLTSKTSKHFEGQTIEYVKDSETSQEVMNDIVEKLKPLFPDVTIETSYGIIVTHKIDIEGDSIETTQFRWTRQKDNQDNLQRTVGQWRKYYAEVHKTAVSLQILQVIASQCIQELPSTVEIADAPSRYTCTSPKIDNPGSISHRLETALPTRPPDCFTSVQEFQGYLASQPKVTRMSPSKFTVNEEHVPTPPTSPKQQEPLSGNPLQPAQPQANIKKSGSWNPLKWAGLL